jgi:hypothetical protein
MSDEKFEDFLRDGAKAYNTPPARTPREEMWNAIQAARSAGPRVVYGGGVTHVRGGEKRFASKVWWAAAAGIVLVASGIGIGRLTTPAPTDFATGPSVTNRPKPAAPGVPAPVDQGPSDVGGGSGDARENQDTRFTPEASRVAVASPSRGQTAESTGTNAGRPTPAVSDEGRTPSRAASPALAYEMAEVNHLTAAEALLTSFRTRSLEDQLQDARLAAWARELLSNTRLLLDSPVAADPQRRPLLQDLELLLVQIVQLSPGTTPQDREIMERTLKQDQLMTRLRTAIPAGQHGS